MLANLEKNENKTEKSKIIEKKLFKRVTSLPLSRLK